MACRWMLALALVSACYAPHEPLIASGDASSGSGDGSTSTATTTVSTSVSTSTVGDETSSEGPASETASETSADLPPELSSFSVNGSDAPSEILEADLVEIQVAATDDIGIDRVEFYDGDTLIATFTEPPYHTQFLVTSAENGGHSYTAIAYDTAEQSAEAGPIPLSISIDGGAVVALQDAGFDANAPLGIFGPHVVATPDRLYVCGSSTYNGAGFSVPRLAVARLTLGLSSSGVSYYPGSPNAATPQHSQIGHGMLEDDGDLLVPVGVGTGNPQRVMRLDDDDGSIAIVLSLGASSNGAFGGLARTPAGEMLMASGEIEVSLYALPPVFATWTADVSMGVGGTPSIIRIAADSEGATILVGLADTNDAFVRKLSPDGDILWTRMPDEVFASGEVGLAWPAVDAQDQVSVVAQRGSMTERGLRLLTYDPDGDELFDVVVADGLFLYPIDVTYDAGGALVIAAMLQNDNDTTDAWLGRFAPDGTEIWSGVIDVGSGNTMATGVVALPDGRLFATGLHSTVAEFLNIHGDTWAAEVAL